MPAPGAPLSLDPRGLLDPSEPALIGVSGGRDSVCLLHALHARGHHRLIVCHLDHGWRVESAAEAEMVAALAAQYGLPAVFEKMPPPGKPASPEQRARAARLAFFARTAAAHGCTAVFLAHHADDQVETLLLNLFRGTGMAGLAGMSPASDHEAGGLALRLLRPLLGVWRTEIDAYAAAHALRYCEDASNADPRHTRNRMRHAIIPELERAFGREIRRTVWRAAEILAAENEWLAADPALHSAGAELRVSEVRALPLALRRRLLHTWLRARGVENVDFADVENALALLEHARPARQNLSGGRHVRRRAGRLFVE